MVPEHNVKLGLSFKISALDGVKESFGSLIKHIDHLIVSCQVSAQDCNLRFSDSSKAYQLQFEFSAEYISNFSVGEQRMSLSHFSESLQKELCCNTQMLLHEIVNCKLSGTFRNMFLESKALALLLIFQNEMNDLQASCSSCKFLTKPVEKEKIIKAREIILSALNSPYTIPELAMLIGINQCYLKKGFKEIYGKTVYEFVQEQRMLKAKLLLTTTALSVSQVADQIGFSSQSNFSLAFKKFTGVFPSELQQN